MINEVLRSLRLAPRSGAFELRDSVVVVTGAGSGIGAATVRELAGAGARVAAIDIDTDAVQRVLSTVQPGSVALTADVTDRDSIADAYRVVRAQLGSIDAVIANAGVPPKAATLRTMQPADFDHVVAVNLTGVFNTVVPALPDVVAAGGHVIVVSSVAAFMPGMGASPYMISKAGVEQFGRALRIELAAVGATAGVAYFGVVETPMTHTTIDSDPVGAAAAARIPWPLNTRVQAFEAGQALVRALVQRSPRTVVPRVWTPVSMVRGIADVAVDALLAKDKGIHALVRTVESNATAVQRDSASTSSTPGESA